MSGITPAISDKAAELTKLACEAAKRHGVTVSVDLNFRKKLLSLIHISMVPTEVPMESEMKQAARKMPASSRLSGSRRSVRLTVASMAPISLAPVSYTHLQTVIFHHAQTG